MPTKKKQPKNQQPPSPKVEEILSRVKPGREVVDAGNIEKKAVPVELRFHMPVNRRQVKGKEKDSIKVEREDGTASTTDRDQLHVSKALLDSDEYKALMSFKTKVRSYMGSQALDTKIRLGAFLVKYDNLTKVDLYLTTEMKAWEVLVEDFMAAYPALKAAAPAKLDVLYDANDYPSEAKLRASFGFDVRYFSYGSLPEDLKNFDSAIYERETKRIQREWNEAIEEMKTLLRSNMAELLKKAVTKLTPGADGKTKQFKKGSLEKLSEFLNLFDARNVTNDTELEVIVSNVRDLLSNVSTEDIKNSEQIRDDVRNQFESVTAKLDGMIENKPGRMVLLDTEDAA